MVTGAAATGCPFAVRGEGLTCRMTGHLTSLPLVSRRGPVAEGGAVPEACPGRQRSMLTAGHPDLFKAAASHSGGVSRWRWRMA